MRADQSFSYGRPCRDRDEPVRLRPIRFDPAHRWFFVRTDINDVYARAMFSMDIALWTAEDALRQSIAVSRNGHTPPKPHETGE